MDSGAVKVHIQVRGCHFRGDKEEGGTSLAQVWEPTPSEPDILLGLELQQKVTKATIPALREPTQH